MPDSSEIDRTHVHERKPLGVAWSLRTERYNPNLFTHIEEKFKNLRIRADDTEFDSGMPLYLVDEADHVLYFTFLGGDNWRETTSDLQNFGNALTLAVDEAGPNTDTLGIFFLSSDFRQDRRTRKRKPDSTELGIVKSQFVFTEVLARQIKDVAGAKYVVGVDMHSDIVFDSFKNNGLEVINLTTARVVTSEIKARGLLKGKKKKDIVVATLDLGDLNRGWAISKKLGVDIAIIAKDRLGSEDGKNHGVVSKLTYGDVREKTVILYDDMFSSGGTSLEAVKILIEAGAIEIILYATTPVFVKDYYKNMQKILSYPQVKLVMTTNSRPIEDRMSGKASIPKIPFGRRTKKVEVIDLGPFLARAAWTILHSPDIQTAKERLGRDALDLVDPYELFKEITGERLKKPKITAIYKQGKFTPLPIEKSKKLPRSKTLYRAPILHA